MFFNGSNVLLNCLRSVESPCNCAVMPSRATRKPVRSPCALDDEEDDDEDDELLLDDEEDDELELLLLLLLLLLETVVQLPYREV
jgi:hypothetical protein